MSTIIHEGILGDVCIIGFPHDIGARRENLHLGAENGPDCTRRFFKKCGPLINAEYSLSLENLVVGDYGNIYI
jgi:formiminoglutamase